MSSLSFGTTFLRITFLSGDVHCGAVGVFKTLVKNRKQPDLNPAVDFRYMANVVTSAIVNTPCAPPARATRRPLTGAADRPRRC